MLHMLQILPLALNLLVGLHLHVGLVSGDEVVEHQGINALLLVFRQDAYQHQVETFCLVELQGSQAMPPAKRPQASVAALLQGSRH